MTEITAFMVAILVAVTSLLSNSGNLPSWWFQFSFAFLMLLMLSIPVIIFARPLNERIHARNEEKKRDAFVKKCAAEFRDLTYRARQFENHIENFFSTLKNHYQSKITTRLCSYVMESFKQNRTESSLYEIEQGIEKSKTYHEFALIAEHFEVVLNTYQRSLKQIEVFVNDLTIQGEQISKGIVDDFEAFREKYNYFLKDVNDFSHKINQQTKTNDFPEHLEYLKKW
jgi:hypothetical protein